MLIKIISKMWKSRLPKLCFGLAVLGVVVGPGSVNAQYFPTSTSRDVLAGFRKTGLFQGNYELVVDFGNITNFLAVPQGSSVTIGFFSSALSDSFPDGFANLQWSVFATFAGLPYSTPFGVFPAGTTWY